MSGFEIFGLVAAIISVTETTIEVYNAIKDLHGLPEAFQEVSKRLPLVMQTLEAAKGQSKNTKSHDEIEALKSVLNSCKKKAEKLLDIFKSIANGLKNDSFTISAYRSVVIKLGKKFRVETLMGDILKDLEVLAAHHIFQAAMQKQVDSLAEAKDGLEKVPPSLPDSDFDEKSDAFNQTGDRNKMFINTGSGTMKNVYGNNFEAKRDQNFGEISPKVSTKTKEAQQADGSSEASDDS